MCAQRATFSEILICRPLCSLNKSCRAVCLRCHISFKESAAGVAKIVCNIATDRVAGTRRSRAGTCGGAEDAERSPAPILPKRGKVISASAGRELILRNHAVQFRVRRIGLLI